MVYRYDFRGGHAFDSEGVDLGELAGMYRDTITGEPSFLRTAAGSYLPLEGSTVEGANLHCAWSASHIDSAPPVASPTTITTTEQAALRAHYGLDGEIAPAGTSGLATKPAASDSDEASPTDEATNEATGEDGQDGQPGAHDSLTGPPPTSADGATLSDMPADNDSVGGKQETGPMSEPAASEPADDHRANRGQVFADPVEPARVIHSSNPGCPSQSGIPVAGGNPGVPSTGGPTPTVASPGIPPHRPLSRGSANPGPAATA
ncbi:MAG: hypothetical protein Q4P33_02500 [Flaviflexus sp.]|nr:hypothetical protein [Flaviflexus sp.]